MSPPVFLRDALAGDRIVLDGPEGRHAAAVRRLRPGERAALTDGAGLVAECAVVSAGRDSLELEVLTHQHKPTPTPRDKKNQAQPKSDQNKQTVETMTEGGVDVIVPW